MRYRTAKSRYSRLRVAQQRYHRAIYTALQPRQRVIDRLHRCRRLWARVPQRLQVNVLRRLDGSRRLTALVIQHVLPKYVKAGQAINFDPDTYIEQVSHLIWATTPDLVIMTREEADDRLFARLVALTDRIQTWRMVSFADFESTRAIADCLGVRAADIVATYPRSGTFATALYPWVRKLAYYDVEVIGAFDGQCVDGIIRGLEALGAKCAGYKPLIIKDRSEY